MSRRNYDELRREASLLYAAALVGRGDLVGAWAPDDEPHPDMFKQHMSNKIMELATGLYSLADMSTSQPPFTVDGREVHCPTQGCDHTLVCTFFTVGGSSEEMKAPYDGDELIIALESSCPDGHVEVSWWFIFESTWTLGQKFNCIINMQTVHTITDAETEQEVLD